MSSKGVLYQFVWGTDLKQYQCDQKGGNIAF